MKETIYLTISAQGVVKMNKNYLGCGKNEIVAKVVVEVDKNAFSAPVIEKHIVINDWQSDLEVKDVQFNNSFITEEEAQIIRDKRMLKMKEILESQGYQITKPEDVEPAEQQG